MFGGLQLHVGGRFGDQVVEHHGLLADQLARFVHACYGRDVGQQAAQASGLRGALFQKVRALSGVEVRVGQQGFQIPLDRRHGGFQFVVDVVRQLFLDADLLLLLVQREGVLAVAVGGGLLQPCVEADDVLRNVAQFVVGEIRAFVDPLAPLGAFGEFVEPRDVLPQAARGEVPRDAHQQRDAQHEPEKFAVGGQHLAQRHGVGHGRADDAAVAEHRRVEIIAVGALGVAADGVTRSAGRGFGHFGPVEVVGGGERVERVVEQNAAVEADDRHAQVAEGVSLTGDESFGRCSPVHGVEHPQVEELQPRVELLGLEMLLAAVLEEDEARHQRPRKEQQQQKQPPVVGEPTLQIRNHSPAVLRCVRRRGLSCGAGG